MRVLKTNRLPGIFLKPKIGAGYRGKSEEFNNEVDPLYFAGIDAIFSYKVQATLLITVSRGSRCFTSPFGTGILVRL